MLLENPPVRLKNPPLARATLIPLTYKASKTFEKVERYTALAGEFINVRDGWRQAATLSAPKDIAAFQADANPLPLQKPSGKLLLVDAYSLDEIRCLRVSLEGGASVHKSHWAAESIVIQSLLMRGHACERNRKSLLRSIATEVSTPGRSRHPQTIPFP
jgi:hypothetical protein